MICNSFYVGNFGFKIDLKFDKIYNFLCFCMSKVYMQVNIGLI